MDPQVVQTMNDLMPYIGGVIKVVGLFMLGFFVVRILFGGIKDDK